jgi:hypothetical protein
MADTFKDNQGRTFNTPDGKAPGSYGVPLTSNQNGQQQQGWWNGTQFVPNK